MLDPTEAFALDLHGYLVVKRAIAPDQVRALVAQAVDTFGKLDILVANAALFADLTQRPFLEIDEEEWDRVMRINTRGVFSCVKEAVPAMIENGYGKIINVSSGTVFKGVPYMLHYVSSKGAILAMTLAMTEGYRRNRLLAFLDPWEDPLNTGYQTIQSLVGVASGGVTGVGLGEGRAKWGYLPEAHTDFIYAVVGEEMGFIGSVMVLALFATLAAVGVRIALRAPDRFGTLVAIGIVVWLVLQALVNVGTVVGVLPITGLPLPFVSFGGTSLVVGMAAIGLLLNIGRQGSA